MARTKFPSAKKAMIEIGATGLNYYDGRISEETMRKLIGQQGIKTYKEMADNDPTIGAVLFAIDKLLRNVPWKVPPVDDSPEAVEVADFYTSCMDDMEHSWGEFIQEALSMLVFGFAPHEMVFKIRDDGKIGWKKLPIRSQDTLEKWEIDDNGNVIAMVQTLPNGIFSNKIIPIEKLLLFRTESRKNNPQGRALDPKTPIPTPDGWFILDDLHVGSKVFDENGHIRYVTARADWESRPCYKIVFNDGECIVADANHQWLASSANDRYQKRKPSLVTTEEIYKNSKTATGTSNYSVDWAGVLDYPHQHLILDPYYLGLWLGDGSSRTSDIACHVDDSIETKTKLESLGFVCTIKPNGSDSKGRSISVKSNVKWDSSSPQSKLRMLNLIQNKHIPDVYLKSSKEQRLSLLQGLMDSDGCVDISGHCEFVNTNMHLIRGVEELVRSLGCSASAKLRKRANGVTHKQDSWCVKFKPTFVPFTLMRKVDRIKDVRHRKCHYIVDVVPVAPRRTVCVEVDSPSHLFLAGRGCVPTHNSILRNCFRPWYFKKRIEEIEGIGIERDLAGLPVAQVPPSLLSADASPEEKAVLNAVKKMITSIRRDEQEGVVFPLAYDENGKEIYKLSLLSTGGSRQFDTSKIIDRYDKRIAMTVLADFIFLGQSRVGSFALSSDKTDMFALAIGAWLSSIADTINRHGVPALGELNGIPKNLWPKFTPGDIEKEDVSKFCENIYKLVSVGALIPDQDVQDKLRELLGLPVKVSDGKEFDILEPKNPTQTKDEK